MSDNDSLENLYSLIDTEVPLDGDEEAEYLGEPEESLETVDESPYQSIYVRINRLGKELVKLDPELDDANITRIRNAITEAVWTLFPRETGSIKTYGVYDLCVMPAFSGHLQVSNTFKTSVFIHRQMLLCGSTKPFNSTPLVSHSIVSEALLWLFQHYNPKKGTFMTALLFIVAARQRAFYIQEIKKKERLGLVSLDETPEAIDLSAGHQDDETASQSDTADLYKVEERSHMLKTMLELNDLLFVGFLDYLSSSSAMRILDNNQQLSVMTKKKTETLGRWKSYYTFDMARIIHTDVRYVEKAPADKALKQERYFIDRQEKTLTVSAINETLNRINPYKLSHIIHQAIIEDLIVMSKSDYFTRLLLGNIKRKYYPKDFDPDQEFKYMVQFHGYSEPTFYSSYKPYKTLLTLLVAAFSNQGIHSAADIPAIIRLVKSSLATENIE